MEMIVISREKIKIMLTRADLEKYSISASELDYANERTRQALRAILSEAGEKVGFDTSPGKLLVQIYESADGGCEMYVSGSPREKDGTEKESVTFALLSFSALTELCRRLTDSGFGGRVSVHVGAGRWYITFFEGECPVYVNDYAEQTDTLLGGYINEHYRRICGENELKRLALL